MKSAIITLSWLSLLVLCDAWFLNLNADKADKVAKTTPSSNTRKVILVARKVYVPMYVSDDTTTSDESDHLLPVSPVLATSGTVMGGPQQQPVDYSSMYYQPPVVANAMSGLRSGGVPATYPVPSAYAAPVPVFVNADATSQQFISPSGYGAAGPQYVQYASAASAPQAWWVMQYTDSEVVPAGPYSPTGIDVERVTQKLITPVESTEAYPSVTSFIA